jgi:hypothetical protein
MGKEVEAHLGSNRWRRPSRKPRYDRSGTARTPQHSGCWRIFPRRNLCMRLGAQPRTGTCRPRNRSIARRHSCPAQHLKRKSASMIRRRHKARHKVRHKTRRRMHRHRDHVAAGRLGPSIAKAPWRSNRCIRSSISRSSHCPPARRWSQTGSTRGNPQTCPILSCMFHSHCSYNHRSPLPLRAPVTPRVCTSDSTFF